MGDAAALEAMTNDQSEKSRMHFKSSFCICAAALGPKMSMGKSRDDNFQQDWMVALRGPLVPCLCL